MGQVKAGYTAHSMGSLRPPGVRAAQLCLKAIQGSHARAETSCGWYWGPYMRRPGAGRLSGLHLPSLLDGGPDPAPTGNAAALWTALSTGHPQHRGAPTARRRLCPHHLQSYARGSRDAGLSCGAFSSPAGSSRAPAHTTQVGLEQGPTPLSVLHAALGGAGSREGRGPGEGRVGCLPRRRLGSGCRATAGGKGPSDNVAGESCRLSSAKPSAPTAMPDTAGLQLPLWQRALAQSAAREGTVRRVGLGAPEQLLSCRVSTHSPPHAPGPAVGLPRLFPYSSNATVSAFEDPCRSRRQAAGPSSGNARPTVEQTHADTWSGSPCRRETQSQWRGPRGRRATGQAPPVTRNLGTRACLLRPWRSA